LLRGHGAVVALRAPADLVALAAHGLAPTVSIREVDADAVPHATVEVDPISRTVRSSSLDAVHAADEHELVRLVASIVQLEIAAHAAPQVFVHAGVVECCGRAIVLPGSSHAGKTTLVRALVAAGASYSSDEYAVLDLDGHVTPFAKPLSVRAEDGRSEWIDPDTLGRVGSGSVPVALVAMLQYREGASFQPVVRRGATVALAIVEHTVPARARQLDTLDASAAVARRAAMVQGERGEAAATAVALLELVDEVASGQPSVD
jgi:predicted ATPase